MTTYAESRALRSALTLLLAGFVVLSLAGCGSDNNADPTIIRAVISGDVFNVSRQGDLSLRGVDDSTYTFSLAFGGTGASLQEGDIIVGIEPQGYLRRVTSISQGAGTIVVETRSARLTDAVIAGVIDTTLNIDIGAIERRASASIAAPTDQAQPAEARPTVSLAPGASVDAAGLDLTGVTLFSGKAGGADLRVAIRHGSIVFNPDLDLGLAIEDRQVKGFKTVANGNLSFYCDAWIEASGAVQYSGETTLATFTTSAVQLVGSFPVTEVITLRFVGGFEVDLEKAGACQFGGENSISVSAGARRKDGSWSPAWVTTADHDPAALEWSANTSLEARVYVRPQLEVAFYSVGGPLINLEPFVSISAAAADEALGGGPVGTGRAANSTACSWNLTAGVAGSLDFHSRIISADLGDYAKNLDEYSRLIESAGGGCACAWTKYEGNPVLSVGSASAHDDKEAHVSCVLKVDSEYWMYYHGTPSWSTNSKYVMLATSPDGINWTKYGNGNEPLDFGEIVGTAPGESLSEGYVEIMGLSVLYNPETAPRFQSWFARVDTMDYSPIDIFYADSDDGINWNLRPEPVVPHSTDSTAFDAFRAQWPCVMKIDGLYHMWYQGHQMYAAGGVGHATSPDGITWTKDPANPVIGPKPMNAPWVVEKDGTYYMYIGSANGFVCATSQDGATWDISGFDRAILGPGPYGQWDGIGVERMAALVDGGILKCWYAGSDIDRWQTGYARCELTP